MLSNIHRWSVKCWPAFQAEDAWQHPSMKCQMLPSIEGWRCWAASIDQVSNHDKHFRLKMLSSIDRSSVMMTNILGWRCLAASIGQVLNADHYLRLKVLSSIHRSSVLCWPALKAEDAEQNPSRKSQMLTSISGWRYWAASIDQVSNADQHWRQKMLNCIQRSSVKRWPVF